MYKVAGMLCFRSNVSLKDNSDEENVVGNRENRWKQMNFFEFQIAESAMNFERNGFGMRKQEWWIRIWSVVEGTGERKLKKWRRK